MSDLLTRPMFETLTWIADHPLNEIAGKQTVTVKALLRRRLIRVTTTGRYAITLAGRAEIGR